jgi:hypothetical protein
MNNVIPGRKGLVRSNGDDSLRQTSIDTYLHSKQTSEKSKTLEKSSVSNNPIALNTRSNKEQLTQSTLTGFLKPTPSIIRLHLQPLTHTPQTRSISVMAATPTKPFQSRQIHHSSVTPLNLAHTYPTSSSTTNIEDIGPRKQHKQSVITSYFTSKVTQREVQLGSHAPRHKPDNTKSEQQKSPYELNMSSKCPSNSLLSHTQPNIGIARPPLQPTVFSAEDLQGQQHPPPPHIEAPFGELTPNLTETPPSQPNSRAKTDELPTNDSFLPSPPQRQPTLPTLGYTKSQLSPQNGPVPEGSCSLNSSLTSHKLDTTATPLSAVLPPFLLPNDRIMTNTCIPITSQHLPTTTDSAIMLPPDPANSRSYRRKGHKSLLLQYNSSDNQPRLSYYQSRELNEDLHDVWGHSLKSIDTSSTFRLFLQNPNGLNLSRSNYSLLKDFDTCQQYGAAVISLPETNSNWESKEHVSILNGMLKRT